MSGWVGKLLAECKADLTAHDDDNRVPIAAGARVQSFFFSGSGDREQPEPNGTDGLDENVDGQFYPGKLHDSDDGPTPFRVVFDDGDEEPASRSDFRLIWAPVEPPSGPSDAVSLSALWVVSLGGSREVAVVTAHNDDDGTYSVLRRLDLPEPAAGELVSRKRMQRLPAVGELVYVPASSVGGSEGGEVACVCDGVVAATSRRDALAAPRVGDPALRPGSKGRGRDLLDAWAAFSRGSRLGVVVRVHRLSGGETVEVPAADVRRAVPDRVARALLKAAGGLASSRLDEARLGEALLALGVWRSREAAKAAAAAAKADGAAGGEASGAVPVGRVLTAVDGSPAGVSATELADPAAAAEQREPSPRGERDEAGAEGGTGDGAEGGAASRGLLLSAVLRRGIAEAARRMQAAEGGGTGGLSRVFAALDVDGDGRLGRDEVVAVLRRLGAPAPADAEVDALQGVLDGDGDGLVTKAELRAFVRGHAEGGAAAEGGLEGHIRTAVLAASVRAASGTGRVLEPRAVFEAMDSNGSGRLSRDELAAGLAAIGCDVTRAEDGEWRSFFGRVDTDGDGGVTYSELVAFLSLEERRGAQRRRWGSAGRMLAGRGVDVAGVLAAEAGSDGALSRGAARALLTERWGVPLPAEDVETLLTAVAAAGPAASGEDARCSAEAMAALLLPAAAAAAADEGSDDDDDGSGTGGGSAARPAEVRRRGADAEPGDAAAWSSRPAADPADVPVAPPEASDDLLSPHPALLALTSAPWDGGGGARAGEERWVRLPTEACSGRRQWDAALEAALRAAAGGDDGIPGPHVTWLLVAMGLDVPAREAEAFSAMGRASTESVRVAARRLVLGSITPMAPGGGPDDDDDDDAGAGASARGGSTRSRPAGVAVSRPSGLGAAALSRVCEALRRCGRESGGRLLARRAALRHVLRSPPLCLADDEAQALASDAFCPSVSGTAGAAALSERPSLGAEEAKESDGEDEDDAAEAKAAEPEAGPQEPSSGAEWQSVCAAAWLASVRLAAAGVFVPGCEVPAAARGLATLAGPACRLPLRAPVAVPSRRGAAETTGDAGPALLFRALRAADLPAPTGVPVTTAAAGAMAWEAARAQGAALAADPGAAVALSCLLGADLAADRLYPGVGLGLDGQAARAGGVGCDGLGLGSRPSDILPQPAEAARRETAVSARPFQSHKGAFFSTPGHALAPLRGLGTLGDPWWGAGASATLGQPHAAQGGLLQCLVDVVAARGVPVPAGIDGRSRVVGRAVRLALVDLVPPSSSASAVGDRPRLLAAGPTLPAAWGPALEDEWHLDPARVHAIRRQRAAAGGDSLAADASAIVAAATSAPGPGTASARAMGPVPPVAWVSAHRRRLTDSADARRAAALTAADGVEPATKPAPGWNSVAVRAAHPRQPVVPGSRGNPHLLVELVAALAIPTAPPDEVGGSAAAPDGLLAEKTKVPGESSVGAAVEVCVGWVTIPLEALATPATAFNRRFRLSGGSITCPVDIERPHSLQRRAGIVGQAGNVLAGHRPPTVELRVTPSRALRSKIAQALSLLPCGGDGGPAGVLIPASAVRAMAAARSASAAVLLTRADFGDGGTGRYAPLALRNTASRIPGGAAGRAPTDDGKGAAGASGTAAEGLDPCGWTEDDLPGPPGAPVAHWGAAAASRAAASPEGGYDLRDTLSAVLASDRRGRPDTAAAAITASALRAEAESITDWPAREGAGRGLGLAAALHRVRQRTGGNMPAVAVADELAAAAAKCINPEGADDGSSSVPFDAAGQVIGSAAWL